MNIKEAQAITHTLSRSLARCPGSRTAHLHTNAKLAQSYELSLAAYARTVTRTSAAGIDFKM
jgi:hypothetical protein